jgi:hypothetical protein
MGRSALSFLALSALVTVLQGCGAGSESTVGSEAADHHGRTPAAAAIRVPPLRGRVISAEHLRRAVLQGIGRDYLSGTQVGPPSFGLCLQRGLRRLLDERTLRSLALVYRRPSGQQFTAQALAELAVPIGDRCGGRRFVPMPIEASMAFRAGHLPAAGVEARLSYGPYVGVTCRPANSTRCDSVGIDLVLRREATAVSARVAGRKLRLRTPGLHTGVAGRDWVGYLDRVGLGRRGSPFHVDSYGRSPKIWAGYPPVYLPVDLEISYREGGRVTGTLPRVSLSPGWG